MGLVEVDMRAIDEILRERFEVAIGKAFGAENVWIR